MDDPRATAPGQSTITVLAGRAIIALDGSDARSFLHGIITNDIKVLERNGALYAGLLSPQGKILFAFFVVADGDRVLLDTDQAHSAALIARLTMYRLRSRFTIEDVTDAYAVVAGWDGPPAPGLLAYDDPRSAALGWRGLVRKEALATLQGPLADETAYHARRVALGIPEAEFDFALGDTFPHEALFDQLGTVSFKKGCFVGQEVVSRMEHRGLARKRIVPFEASSDIKPGDAVMAGDVAIGRTGTVAGRHGLAMVRLDRAAEAYAKGLALTVDGGEIQLRKPDWARYDVPMRGQ